MRIPLVWPRGTYGLPMPKDGCPKGSDFVWHTGTRYRDMENIDPKAFWSAEWDMAGHYSKSTMEQNNKDRNHIRSSLAERKVLHIQEGRLSRRFVESVWTLKTIRKGYMYAPNTPQTLNTKETLVLLPFSIRGLIWFGLVLSSFSCSTGESPEFLAELQAQAESDT